MRTPFHGNVPSRRSLQNSLEQGAVPDDRRDAPFEKGSKSASQNYRHVSLTSVICMLIESIIKDEIINDLNNFKLINGSQHGCTKGRSCLTNLLEFLRKLIQVILLYKLMI